MNYENQRPLFEELPLEIYERMPIRPIGLSNFVVEELPRALEGIREKKESVAFLADYIETFAEDVLLQTAKLAKNKQEKEILITRLDILMVNAAIIHEGGVVGPSMSKLVEYIAKLTNRPETLTYEDIVINNPINDIRTFTRGLVGTSEASFYNGHRYIEEVLEPSIHSLSTILKQKNDMNTDEIVERMKDVIRTMKQTIKYAGVITQQMPTEHYAGTFRKYLGTLPNGLRGPSGAFTARIPLIEYLLMGETIPEVDIGYQYDELKYFPLTHQQALINTLENAKKDNSSVRQVLISRGSPKDGMDTLEDLSNIFKTFRNVHLIAVKTHLPEVFEGNAPGTGGNEVNLLLRRIKRTHDL